MRFLLIGGIGYIGGRLTPYLKSQGHYVRVTTRRTHSQIPAWVTADDVVQTDLNDVQSVAPALHSIDQVIHLAAPNEIQAAEHPATALQAGAVHTWNVLESIDGQTAEKRPRLIYLSTFHVYGPQARGEIRENTPPNPVHPYALGRHLGEVVVDSFRKRHTVQSLVVRLSNAFGAAADVDVPRWSLVFNDLCRQAVAQKKLVLKTPGFQKRNFITLQDTVRALEWLATQASWPEDGLIHLGSSAHWSIREVADRIATVSHRHLGYRPAIEIPTAGDPTSIAEFHFNVDRLQALGFTWTNAFDKEIEDILQIVRGASTGYAPTTPSL